MLGVPSRQDRIKTKATRARTQKVPEANTGCKSCRSSCKGVSCISQTGRRSCKSYTSWRTTNDTQRRPPTIQKITIKKRKRRFKKKHPLFWQAWNRPAVCGCWVTRGESTLKKKICRMCINTTMKTWILDHSWFIMDYRYSWCTIIYNIYIYIYMHTKYTSPTFRFKKIDSI